jgi:death on curing protein
MKSWVWLSSEVLLAVQDELLAEHGGAAGVRDRGLFLSAMAKARNSAHYGEPDFAALAAAYGCGIARNHPFVDGTKRTAFVAVEPFLACNGYALVVDGFEGVLTILAVASGALDETNFAAWIRQHALPGR